jgi:MFS family permease
MGFVIAGVVALIVLAAYNWNVSDGVWRVCFGLGMALPVALLFFRLRLINSTQYQKHAMKQHIPYWLVIKRYWKPMLGTSLAWFMYDFVVSGKPFSMLMCKNGTDDETARRTPLAFSVQLSSRHSIPTTR